MLLLMTVFNYETPKFLKLHNKNAELNKLMGRIYEPDRIVERINIIVVGGESGNGESPSYG